MLTLLFFLPVLTSLMRKLTPGQPTYFEAIPGVFILVVGIWSYIRSARHVSLSVRILFCT